MSKASAMPLTARRAGALRGTADIPGDKSVSHRALILAALTVGESRVTGLLEGEDVLATAGAMRAFGAEVTRGDDGGWTIHGVGVGGFAEPADIIDCGNAGTAVRLIMGSMATTPVTATFTGDASLRRRPMGRVLEPLRLFGAASMGRRRRPAAPDALRRARPGAGRVPAARRLGAGQVGGAAGRAERARRDGRHRGAKRRETTPSACCAGSARN